MTNLKVIQQKAKRRIESGAGDFIWETHEKLVEVVRKGVFDAFKKAGFKDVDKQDLMLDEEGDETDSGIIYPSMIPVKILPIKNSPVAFLTGNITVPAPNIGIDGDVPSDFLDVDVQGFYDELHDDDSGHTLRLNPVTFSCEFTKDWKKIQKFQIG